MSETSVRVLPGDAIEPHMRPGAVIVLAAGVHHAPLVVECDVTLRGEPGAVLDAQRGGSAVSVMVDALTVKLEGLTLRGGAGEAGGGLQLTGWSEVSCVNVTFEDNEARLSDGGVGGGAFVLRGTLTLEDCTFRRNEAGVASDLAVWGASRALVRGGFFAGDLSCREGAELTMVGSHVTGRLDLRGTTTRVPRVVLKGARIDGGVHNDVNNPAALSVEDG